jgi:hypothetical protein
MKKSTLALSVAAAISGLGFVGNALAIGTVEGALADEVAVNAGGIGHQLVFPYFSVQGDNATLINITNTDSAGKVVKVRFRGAANSDDLFDFQVLLSPHDVWTASVTQNPSTGVAMLTTSDTTCTLPAEVKSPAGVSFVTNRVDSTKNTANETREGYIEVINMADVPSGSNLFNTIVHKAGVPDCSAGVLETALGTDVTGVAGALARGMTPPTGGLTGDWIILNQSNTAAWSGSAAALEARLGGARSAANLVFWPQKFGTPTNPIDTVTADPLLVQGLVAIQNYDLPDLSTPYLLGETPAQRADRTSRRLAVASVANQFVTSDGIAAVTDMVFSQPTRRYSTAINYANGTRLLRDDVGSAFYNAGNTEVSNRQVCLSNLLVPSQDALFDREEGTPGEGSAPPFVISPNDPVAPTKFLLCGETAVASINGADNMVPSALNASVVRNNILFDEAYTDGWLTFDTSNGGSGLPILGASFIRASNGMVNYGFTWTHKTTRPMAP